MSLATEIPAIGPRFDRRLALVLLFVVIWSSAFPAAKIALADAPPLLLLTLRFLLAGVLAVGAGLALGKRLGRRDLAVLVLAGMLNNALYLGFSFSGMRTVSGGLAAILVSCNPILTAILAGPLLGERMNAAKAVGLVLGLAGVAFILRNRLGGGGEDPAGVLLLLAALVSLVAGTLLFKRLAPGGDLWLGNGVQSLAGGLGLLPVALLSESPAQIHWTAGFVGALLYLALVVSVVGFALWFLLVRRLGATAASSLHFLMPPAGLLLGWLVLGEEMPPLDLVGVVPVALGIWLVARPTGRR